jgi:hypothetical protein
MAREVISVKPLHHSRGTTNIEVSIANNKIVLLAMENPHFNTANISNSPPLHCNSNLSAVRYTELSNNNNVLILGPK